MTPDQLLERLLSEPLYLFKLIVYNNPGAVARQAEAMGIPGAVDQPEDLVELLLEANNSLSGGDWLLLFDIEPDPQGYEGEILKEAFNLRYQKVMASQIVLPSWSNLFGDTLLKVGSEYDDFVGSPEEEPQEEANPDGSPVVKKRRPCGCMSRERERWICGILIVAAIIGLIWMVRRWNS